MNLKAACRSNQFINIAAAAARMVAKTSGIKSTIAFMAFLLGTCVRLPWRKWHVVRRIWLLQIKGLSLAKSMTVR
jgi:hypothetical protein